MAVCPNCSAPLRKGASFCRECGAPIDSEVFEERSREQFGGTVKKCPNCGEPLRFSDVACPACGSEVRGIEGLTSLNRLAFQLERIEAEAPTKIEADHRKAEYIRNFAVPNTREDIFEFMVLASTNVDTELLRRGSAEKTGLAPVAYEAKAALSKAWLAKAEQLYQKAQYLLSEEEFAPIKAIFEKELVSVSDIKYVPKEQQTKEKIRRGKIFPNVPTAAIVVAVIALCCVWQGAIAMPLGIPTTVQGAVDMVFIALGIAFGLMRND